MTLCFTGNGFNCITPPIDILPAYPCTEFMILSSCGNSHPTETLRAVVYLDFNELELVNVSFPGAIIDQTTHTITYDLLPGEYQSVIITMRQKVPNTPQGNQIKFCNGVTYYLSNPNNTVPAYPGNLNINIVPVKKYIPSGGGDVNISDLATAQFDYVFQPINNSPTAVQHVFVDANLVIDVDYTFSTGLLAPGAVESKILLGPGKKIIIPNGKTLTLNGAKISSCNVMWNGIENFGHLISKQYFFQNSISTFIKNPIIENAQNGITLLGGTINCTNTRFSNNMRSIFVPSDFLKSLHTSNIEGNLFIGDGKMKQSFQGQQLYGQRPYCAIEAQNVNNLNISGCELNGLENGLLLKDSRATVKNCKFVNFTSYTGSNSSFKKTGIYAYGLNYPYYPSLTVQNNSSILSGSNDRGFFNVESPIIGDLLGQVIVNKVAIRQCNSAIRLYHNYINDINISENDIEAAYRPILLNTVYYPANSIIKDNKLSSLYNLSSAPWEAILLNDVKKNSTPLIIKNNKISTFRKGINCLSCKGVDIFENSVSLQSNTYKSGIELSGSELIRASCNDLFSSSATNGWDPAILVNYSINNLLTCNQTNHTSVGLRLNGSSNPTIYKGTYFKNHPYFGLLLDIDAITEDQLYLGNKWVTPGQWQFGARNTTMDKNWSDKSQIRVDDDYAYNVTTVKSEFPDWFNVNDDQGSTFLACGPVTGTSSGSITNCEGIDPGAQFYGHPLDSLDWRIAIHEMPSTVYGDARVPMLEQRLYNRILQDSSLLINASSDFPLFIQDYSTSPSSFLAEIRRSVESAFLPNSGLVSQLIINRVQDDSIHNIIRNAELTIETSTDTQQINILRALIGLCYTSLNTLALQIRTIGAEEKTNREAVLNNLINENDQISSELEEWDINQKTVNSYWIKLLRDNRVTLSTSEYNELYAIAVQCPDAGGDAVFLARSLLLKSGQLLDLDDAHLCEEYAQSRSTQKNEKTRTLINVSPNPTSDILKLFFEKNNQLFIQNIEIINSIGIIVSKIPGNVVDYSHTIDANILQPGYYTLRVTWSDLYTEYIPFIKVH